MKLFKKLAINVHSRVEAVADHLENKEALSTAYIREYERIAAKAKVRTAQIESEVTRLEKEMVHLKDQSDLWAERARQVYAGDETKALECVARMKQVQAAYRLAQSDLADAQNLKQKMAKDVEHIMKKLDELKRRHRNLAGRQVCADAVQVLQSVSGGIQDNIDNLLSRWETDVVTQELHSRASHFESDNLAKEFDTIEQQQDLRLTLDEIIAGPNKKEER